MWRRSVACHTDRCMKAKEPTDEDQIWQSCKEVHSKRPPRQVPFRCAHGAPGCSLAGKEAPGTTGRHPNGPSPKQPSPCRPHIMALRTAMSAPPAATETKISRVAGRMTAHVSPDPPIRPTYRAARAMPAVRGACQAAMRAARPNHSARTGCQFSLNYATPKSITI